jgi:hypothetical protein
MMTAPVTAMSKSVSEALDTTEEEIPGSPVPRFHDSPVSQPTAKLKVIARILALYIRRTL